MAGVGIVEAVVGEEARRVGVVAAAAPADPPAVVGEAERVPADSDFFPLNLGLALQNGNHTTMMAGWCQGGCSVRGLLLLPSFR